MPNCHVQKETSFQNQRKICRQCLICKVYLNLKGLAPNRTYINYIDNLCAIYFPRAIYNFSPKFAHNYLENCHPTQNHDETPSLMLDLVVFLGQIFTLVLKLGRLEPRWESILWFQVTVSREKSKVHVTAEVQIFGVHWELGGWICYPRNQVQMAASENYDLPHVSPYFQGLKLMGFSWFWCPKFKVVK